ncbi:MAG: MarR family transcriptional regulator [Acidimicrobiales bacterium]|nr:MarR family transcriptional regulator [Acidimicrobiales bacterium]
MARDERTEAGHRDRLARDAWSQITRLFLSQQDRRSEVAAKMGLAATDLISLFHIPPDVGVIQRDLAEHWACDPSWVTARIDRLENLGLVERRPGATDRRVKAVWLTDEGRATRDAGLDAFNRPPDLLLGLSTRDLSALARALGQLDLPDPTQILTRARAAAD